MTGLKPLFLNRNGATADLLGARTLGRNDVLDTLHGVFPHEGFWLGGSLRVAWLSGWARLQVQAAWARRARRAGPRGMPTDDEHGRFCWGQPRAFQFPRMASSLSRATRDWGGDWTNLRLPFHYKGMGRDWRRW